MTFTDTCVEAIEWSEENKIQAKALIAMEYTAVLRAMNLEGTPYISKLELVQMIVQTCRLAGATDVEIADLVQNAKLGSPKSRQ